MAKNFYNLPPPWNPGYALPKSVQDEGLERRAFVTAQAPRGTYDSVNTGTGGYAVPQYVMKEGTGRGTHTTKWLPRGYIGPNVPNWLDPPSSEVVSKTTSPNGTQYMKIATMSGYEPVGGKRRKLGRFGQGGFGQRGLGDVSGSGNVVTQYGPRAASAILAEIRNMPPVQADQVLKLVLNAIDPTLYGKVEDYAKQADQAGVPKQQALQAAISRAMNEGMLHELDKTGRSGSAPQARSLLGLGCFGCAAVLGAMDDGLGATPQCGPNPAPGFTWEVGADGKGYWSRVRYGSDGKPMKTPMPNPDPNYCAPLLSTENCSPNPPPGLSWVGSGWVRVAPGQPQNPKPGVPCLASKDAVGPVEDDREYLEVGPFKFPITDNELVLDRIIYGTSNPNSPVFTKEWPAEMKEAIRQAYTTSGSQTARVVSPDSKYTHPEGSNWSEIQPWLTALGITPDTPVNPRRISGVDPIFIFKHPKYNKDWTLRVAILSKNKTNRYRQTADHPFGLYVMVKPKPEVGWFKRIIGYIGKGMGGVVKAATEVVEKLADIACDTVTTPGAAGAAAAASGGTAAVGVVIAGSICGGPDTPQPPPAVAETPSLMPTLLLGGGLLAVLAIATRKKKGPKTP